MNDKLVSTNTGVGATTIPRANGWMDWTQTLIQGYLASEVIKKSNPQAAQYSEYGVLTQADRTQTTQSTASNRTQQSVAGGINTNLLLLGGAVVVGLLIWFKK